MKTSTNQTVKNTPANTPILSRRQFVKGIVLTSVAAAVASQIPSALANGLKIAHNATQYNPNQPVLSGKDFALTIGEDKVNITGNPAVATLVNGSLPAPTLIWREGDTVTIKVTNNLNVDSSIHWHGIILPSNMDGVPGFSYDGIKPGETFTYQFTLKQTGTYWYHSHSGYQEQTGVYGAIVILPKKAEPVKADYDHVIQLSDWSDTPPDEIYSNLKKMGDYYNFSQRTLGDLFSDWKEKGFSQTWKDRSMWNKMRMSDRDISDVSGSTYTYLMNGLAPNAHWRAIIESGKTARLRVINSSAMTFFDVRIPGLKMTVVAADGNLIQPVEVDEFRIGVAETYDVLVTPDTAKQPYAIFAQAIDRSGYAMGSLTNQVDNLATTPKMDPQPILTMTDMGMSHDMKGMPGMDMSDKGGEHSGHNKKVMSKMKDSDNKPAMQGMPGMSKKSNMQGMSNMKGMQHDGARSGMKMSKQPDYTHALTMEKMKMGIDVSDVKHSDHKHSMAGMNVDLDKISIPMNMNPKLPIIDVPKAEGIQIEMRAMDAQYRLDDPGVGLRNNGRKVLTYADLRNLYPTRHRPKPTRELILHLTGNMERYMWSIDGLALDQVPALEFNDGETIRITFINDTMMNHPMHLHGVWSDLETGDENHIPRKHTIVVQPGAKISYRVAMDAKGDWAFHCHMLYHMMGMFRRVRIS